MPVFMYKAVDTSGGIQEGTMETNSRARVLQMLRQQNYFPLVVEERPRLPEIPLAALAFKGRLGRQESLTFTQQLASMFSAGIELDRALRIIADLSPDQKIRKVAEQLAWDVRGGKSLSAALARHTGSFPRYYTSTVEAGEQSGALGPMLQRLAQSLESAIELRNYVIAALIYPSILAVVSAGAVAMLLLYVIPKFVPLFAQAGQALPMSTQAVVAASNLLTDYWWGFLAGGVFIVVSWRSFVSQERGRLVWDHWKLGLPILGDLIRKREASRFARTLATMLEGGVSLLTAIRIVKDSLDNRAISSRLCNLEAEVAQGRGFASSLARANIFHPLLEQMVAVGEETGRMEEMLGKGADFIEADLRNKLKRLVSLVEPMVILFMGLVVGFIVISMLLAVFSINEIPF